MIPENEDTWAIFHTTQAMCPSYINENEIRTYATLNLIDSYISMYKMCFFLVENKL